MQELADLEQEALDERLSGVDTVPAIPTQPLAANRPTRVAEDDEAEQLRQLHASLAM